MKTKVLSLLLLITALGSWAARADYKGITIGGYAELRDCKGFLYVSDIADADRDLVEIRLDNVKNCTQFDVRTSDNQTVMVADVKLRGVPGSMYRIIIVPRSQLQYDGLNSLMINFKNSADQTVDIVRVDILGGRK